MTDKHVRLLRDVVRYRSRMVREHEARLTVRARSGARDVDALGEAEQVLGVVAALDPG
jgi:hypothetical protein